MIIPCKDIAVAIQSELKEKISQLSSSGSRLKLVDILIGDSAAQDSYVRIKARKAQNVGADFELLKLPETVSQVELVQVLKQKSADQTVTGIIIQQPFPPHLDPQELFAAIPFEKEIEGHKPGSTFLMPIALAVLTAIKWLALQLKIEISENPLFDLTKDASIVTSFLEGKNIVILGRGPTGGAPIARAFDKLGVLYTQIHSQTENPDEVIQGADIVISAVGKKVLGPHNIKKGAILLNLGLHHDGEKLMGDYTEDEISNIATYYTETPGGLGPIDVLYLYANLIEAAKKSAGFT